MDKKTISWFMAILWMALIFSFSHQPRENSNKLSTDITERIIEVIENITPNKDINTILMTQAFSLGRSIEVVGISKILVLTPLSFIQDNSSLIISLFLPNLSNSLTIKVFPSRRSFLILNNYLY